MMTNLYEMCLKYLTQPLGCSNAEQMRAISVISSRRGCALHHCVTDAAGLEKVEGMRMSLAIDSFRICDQQPKPFLWPKHRFR
jgi:hypothetical protein